MESLVSAMSSLKSQIVGQQSALNLLLEKASALQVMNSKTKSPQVSACHVATKDASTNTSSPSHESTSPERPRRQLQQQPQRQRKQLTQQPQQPQQRRQKQQQTRTTVNPEPDTNGSGIEEWLVVNRKPCKPRATRPPNVESGREATSKRSRRPPLDVIAIKPGTEHTFEDILKAVRNEFDVNKTEAHITSISESKGGEVLIRVTKGETKRSGLEAAIRDALGDRTTVRGLVNYADLDITGLDSVTTDSEVADALKKAAGLSPTDTLHCTADKLNWCKAAQALMHQLAVEKSADFLILSECNKADSSWHVDANNKVAIVNAKHSVITSTGTSEAGFRWISAAGIRIYFCYWSPNTSLADFQDFLFRSERNIRLSTEDILIAGDFNAKHADWGSKTNYRRGESLSDMIHALGLLVCNKGNDPTFKNDSIIDVTFSSPGVTGVVIGWGVSKCWNL
ncbi:hypothetical protein QTP88_009867 [Uroleucon formosanum]